MTADALLRTVWGIGETGSADRPRLPPASPTRLTTHACKSYLQLHRSAPAKAASWALKLAIPHPVPA